MRRRDVIQALCGLLGVGTLATRRVRAAAPRQILLARLHVAGTAYYDAGRTRRPPPQRAQPYSEHRRSKRPARRHHGVRVGSRPTATG